MRVYTIASAAGLEGSIFVGKLLEQNNPDSGYDQAGGEYVDVAECGIVDPLKSTCSELESAMCSFVRGVVLSTRIYQLLNMKAGSG